MPTNSSGSGSSARRKNNGVLLLVAPNEHRVRIEVGYGLEGTLTDALSAIVIANAMTPRFKANDFGGGIKRGVDDIITILTTDWPIGRPGPRCAWTTRTKRPHGWGRSLLIAIFMVILLSAVARGFARPATLALIDRLALEPIRRRYTMLQCVNVFGRLHPQDLATITA